MGLFIICRICGAIAANCGFAEIIWSTTSGRLIISDMWRRNSGFCIMLAIWRVRRLIADTTMETYSVRVVQVIETLHARKRIEASETLRISPPSLKETNARLGSLT